MSEDVFKTSSGRDVKLRIFSEEQNIVSGKVDWAMSSLKKAMACVAALRIVTVDRTYRRHIKVRSAPSVWLKADTALA